MSPDGGEPAVIAVLRGFLWVPERGCVLRDVGMELSTGAVAERAAESLIAHPDAPTIAVWSSSTRVTQHRLDRSTPTGTRRHRSQIRTGTVRPVPEPRDILRQEARAFSELAALHRDPIFFGRGAPRGDGRLVVVVPGLFGNDVYLQPLRGWLARIGYSPLRSALVINAGCPDRLRGEVERSLQRHLEQRPGPIAFVGHSRGGMLSWAMASRLQERVSHLVLVGSPAPAVVAMMRRSVTTPISGVATSTVAAAGQRALRLMDPDCTVPACGCPYTDDIRRPLHPSTRVLSIFSREDPIVPPGACRVRDGENVEVAGSHGGLVANRAVYPHLARFLAAR